MSVRRRRRRVSTSGGAGGSDGGAAIFPARTAVSRSNAAFFARGAPAPSPHELGNRSSLASVWLDRRTVTTYTIYVHAYHSRVSARINTASDIRTKRARAAKIVSSWPGLSESRWENKW